MGNSTKARLTTLLANHPHTQYWLTADYTEQEIKNTIKKLKNNKAYGNDGITAETYKTLAPWITRQIIN